MCDDNEQPTQPEERVPLTIAARAKAIKARMLPTKSAGQYETAFANFERWLVAQSTTVGAVTEDDLFVYVDELLNQDKKSASTVWKEYSMIKATLSVHGKVSAVVAI